MLAVTTNAPTRYFDHSPTEWNRRAVNARAGRDPSFQELLNEIVAFEAEEAAATPQGFQS